MSPLQAMAFATNSSAFGIKSTAPANASIFGASKPAGQTGSIFGNPQQQQQQPPTSGFGSAPALAQTQQGQQQQPSIFGSFGQTQQQPATGGGLFGQPAQQQQQQQPQQQPNAFGGGSLFGANNTGANNQNQQSNQQGQQGGGFGGGFGIFGSGAQQQQQQPQQQQQQQQQQGGLWGGGSTTNTSNTGGPNPLQAQATLPAGGFGTGGGFGGQAAGSSLFGNRPQQQQQQQQQPQQSLGYSNAQSTSGPSPFTKSTKFNDLPDEVKRMLESLDSHIQSRIQISKELHQSKLGEEATKGQELIRSVHKDLVSTATTLRADVHFTRDLKTKVDQAVEDTIVATRIVDGFRNPQTAGGYLKDHAGFPLEYFSRITEQMRERLLWYRSTIEQIERKLTSSANQAQTPQGISSTLQAQHTTFLALASKTAAIDAELQKIKALYTQLWRAKTGSARDPFDEIDRSLERGGDFGMGGLALSIAR